MNEKKVGILTFFNRMNYGAELQAYGLHRKVRDLGYDCELLDVLSPENPSAKKPELYKPFSPTEKKLSIKGRINTKAHKLINSTVSLLYSERIFNRKYQFAEFKEKHMNVSARKYRSVDELYCCGMPYDIMITGSDQVWNPQALFSSPEPYFLTFVNRDIKKISYAASFGVLSIPDGLKDKYAEWLANIDYISVRENHGADIVREISGRKAEVVVDPTLLLRSDDWDLLAAETKIKKPYILIYALAYSPYINRLAYRISKRTGLSIVRIARGIFREGIEAKINNLYEAGPSEFLGLFKNASFILTTSFHGTAFSVNYNKPFYTVVRKTGEVNSRMMSLLGNLNLRSRMLFVDEAFPEEKDWFEEFSEAQITLEKEREKSISFLISALKD